MNAAVIGRSHQTSPVVGDIAIRREILRSTPLRRTLRNGGALWRTSPYDLPEDKCRHLWHQSKPCSEIQVFYSHAWMTPGWQKFIALTVQHCMFRAWAFGICTLAVMISLDLIGRRMWFPLGTCSLYARPFGLWEPGAVFNPWTITVPPVMMISALFMDPYLSFGENPSIFLDATCINQVHADLKQEGINSLAGFLANSHELHILWSPPWGRRKWCLYELAVFVAVKGDALVKFHPVFLGCAYFCVIVGLTITCLCSGGLPCVADGNSALALSVFPVALVLLASGIFCIRFHIREMKVLDEQLSNFDVSVAECRDAADSDFISQSIRHWHVTEDSFNSFVQGRLKEKVMNSVNEAGASYKPLLYVSFPLACYGAGVVTAHAHISWNAFAHMAFAAIQAGDALFVMPVACRATLCICGRVCHRHMGCSSAMRCRAIFVEVVISTSIALAVGLMLTLCRLSSSMLHSMVPHGGFVYFGFTAVLCWLVFTCRCL